MCRYVDLSSLIERCPELLSLSDLAQTKNLNCWLVGGTIRDLLLQRDPADIDLCCDGDPTAIVQQWSRQVGGHWFWLDRVRKQSRVLLRSGVSLDFAPLRAATLREDQLLRDITINAIAVPLQLNGSLQPLIDPCKGVDDLNNQRICDCSPQSFPDDPLRMLKGIRHALVFNFAIADETLTRIQDNSVLLNEVAGERIREEFCRILVADIGRGLEVLLATGLLKIITGIDAVSKKNLEQLILLDLCLKALEEQQVLPREAKETIAIRPLILLAELLRVQCDETVIKRLLKQRLRFSKHQQQLVLCLQQQIPTATLEEIPRLERVRQRALYYESLQPCAWEKLLRWGVCHKLLTSQSLDHLHQSYLQLERGGRIPDLLDGHHIVERMHNSQKWQIGHFLQEIKEAEINGTLVSKNDAQSWLDNKLAIDR
jgi:tRNA nucleotidyltransferase/poly(A) polymerase